MGGHGSGGMRPGSGPKRQDEIPADAPLPKVERPDGLSDAEASAWAQLAPLAIQQRTLTPETAARFQLLCRQIVAERAMADRIEADGLVYIAVTVDGSGKERETLKAHPLVGPQRGLMQRIEAGMLAFRLAPMGKALLPATKPEEKPKSALEALQSRRLRAVK
jgi:hypothetical protein